MSSSDCISCVLQLTICLFPENGYMKVSFHLSRCCIHRCRNFPVIASAVVVKASYATLARSRLYSALVYFVTMIL